MEGRRWSVEFSAGGAWLSPDDLNAFSRYDEMIYGTYYERQAAYIRSTLGPSSSSSFQKEGDFPRIENARQGSVSVGYRLTRRLTAMLGLSFLDRSQSAEPSRVFESTTVNPNAVSFITSDTITVRFAPVRLEVRSYAPTVGVQWRAATVGPVDFSALARSGMAWGRTRIHEDRTSSTAFYRRGSTSTLRMTGTGRAFVGEAGGRVTWRIGRRAAIFGEGTYHRERYKKISGKAASTLTLQDGDAASAEKETSGSADGQWRLFPYAITTAWGSFSQPYPMVGGSHPAFALDLSGARFHAGVSLRF